MLLCIGDLCNFGVFHSELKHDCGGNRRFTSIVFRNLWDKNQLNLECSLKKTWAYTRTINSTFASPTLNHPFSSLLWLAQGGCLMANLFLVSVGIKVKYSVECIPVRAKIAHSLVHYLIN